MRSIGIIFRHFLSRTFSRKINYLFFFLLPVLSFIASTFLFGIPESSILTIGFENRDRGELGSGLVSRLEEDFRLTPLSLEAGKKAVLEGDAAFYFQVPENFSSRVLEGKAPEVSLISIGEEGAFVAHGINQYTGGLLAVVRQAGGDQKLFQTLYEEFRTPVIDLKVTGVKDRELENQVGNISIGIFIYIILIQAGMITGLLLKEKEEGTFYRIRLAPVRAVHYILGNLLATFFVLASQIILSLVMLHYLFRIDLTVPFSGLLGLLLAFSFAAVGLGLWVSSLGNSFFQGTMIFQMIITPSSMLGGCFWPLSLMPSFVRKAGALFPQTWAMTAVEQLQRGESPGAGGYILLPLFGIFFLALYLYNVKHQPFRSASISPG